MSTHTLNSAQNAAASSLEGPLLILAGAGAGKTKTIVERIARIVGSGVEPEKILAITFTNKAAREMRERVLKRLEEDPSLIRSGPRTPFVSTFHALGVRIIKEQSHRLGLPKHFAILDRAESKKIVREAIRDLGLDPKQYDPGKLLSLISKEKGNGEDIESFAVEAEGDFARSLTLSVWRKYEATLRKEKALDFDDLLLKTSQLLRIPEVQDYYQKKWLYIHIDEYQDTNKVQYDIAKQLAGPHHNICVVGDIDQNIYSWRGARLRNILDFEKEYPEAKSIVLEENYRSTKRILDVANTIIKKNTFRKDKNLFTNNPEGDPLGLFAALDEADEAQFVVSKCKSLLEDGADPQEIAVLYRANFQSRVLEEAFLGGKIPYQVLGTRFFERKEVRDVLAYVGAALDPENLSFIKRIINIPARGIGKVGFLKIAEGRGEELPPKPRAQYQNFLTLLRKIRRHIETEKPSEVMRFVIEATGLEEFHKKDEDGVERVENMQELVTLAKRYDDMPGTEGVEQCLTDASLGSDQDELDRSSQSGVRLMTVHAAKGLEFSYVFITGLEEGLFPHSRDDDRYTGEEQEEERRLFYVALTRARKKLFLSYAQARTLFGSRTVNIPSEFIVDIPEEHIEDEESNHTPKRKPLLTIDF